MNIKVPYKIRVAIYVVTLLGTPIIAILVDAGILPQIVQSLWAAEVAAAAGLAAINVTPDR